ncbi:hypothetical protein CsatB_030465 [Cannabis sativa]
MIPTALLSKIGSYQIQFGGVTVKVNLIDHAGLLNEKIAEFRNYIGTQRRLVGIDTGPKRTGGSTGEWLLLCSGSQCLMIDLRIFSYDQTQGSFHNFMADESICFVGLTGSGKKNATIPLYTGITCKTEVGLEHLAARVLKKSQLLKCFELEKLGAEVGCDVKPNTSLVLSQHVIAFSKEEMKQAIYGVYHYFLIGHKLLGLL